MNNQVVAFESEHARTHRRWAGTVLAVYGVIVAVGITATLIHKSIVVDQAPAMQVQASR